ncbi:MAG: hypothetical protein OEV44_05160 [Spirochaetota bacterium]|nr:hypothetical protein [Spirochaetota bacterium]
MKKVTFKNIFIKILKYSPILVFILHFLLFSHPVAAQEESKDLSLTPFKLKKKPPHSKEDIEDLRIDSEKKRAKQKIKEKDDNFSNVTVSILGVYDIFNDKFGTESRIYVDSNRLFVPIEWLYLFGDYIRIRTWPQIYFSKRETNESTSAFASIYTDSIVKNNQNDASNTEIGLGGGFNGGGFNLSVWLTSNIYQGTPVVKDLFSFRTRATFQPNKTFYGTFGMRIGTAMAKGTFYSTSATTFDLELDFGITVWKGLTVFFGMEIRTDNLGGLLNSGASITGISDVIKPVAKFGVGYKF